MGPGTLSLVTVMVLSRASSLLFLEGRGLPSPAAEAGGNFHFSFSLTPQAVLGSCKALRLAPALCCLLLPRGSVQTVPSAVSSGVHQPISCSASACPMRDTPKAQQAGGCVTKALQKTKQNKTPSCLLWHFSWCKYTHRGQCEVTERGAELGRDV